MLATEAWLWDGESWTRLPDTPASIHAAFWHDNFGREMSHGCVNLSPLDAKVVFNFVEPRLPRGWHGAFATPEHPGSLVVLHE